MEFVVRAEAIKDWLSGNLPSNALPSSSTLCSTMCRRAASFPVVNGHHPAASLLKVRSQSESDGLNRLGLIATRSLIIENIKKCQNTIMTVHEKQSENADSQLDADSISIPSKNNDDGEHLNSPPRTVVVSTAKKPSKSVRFADDCGKELATVRVMTEPSDYPPTISPSVIRRLLGKPDEEDEETEQITASWIISFKQPASEYVKFRETLDKGCVALENIMLKNEVCRMVGTVKVKNITFEKKVFIRFTSDGWKSFLDRVAVYQPSSSKFYDTFSFEVELPSNGNDPNARIEFCICFETTTPGNDKPQQYWDSNGGRNYALTSPESGEEPRHVPTLFGKQDLNDAYTSDYENWTRFAAWRNLSTEGPYW